MNPWLEALRALPWILGLTLLLATASDAFHHRRARKNAAAGSPARGQACGSADAAWAAEGNTD